MPTLAEVLTDVVREAAAAIGHGDKPVDAVVPTANAQHGDYQSNFAFRLAKQIKTNPRALAQQLVDALPKHPAVEKADVAGPGFVNFKLADGYLAGDVRMRASDPNLGAPQPGAGRTMVIDYSSPNIAKRMHVGHLRSTIIGNAIDRMHRFLGWKVIADNHTGDWGTQFGKLIVMWDDERDEDAFLRDPIGELQRLYQLFGARQKEDATLIERARQETVKLQQGDARNRALWERFVDESMKEFDSLYARMGVHFDVTLGESFYRDVLDDLVEELLAKGVATVSEGAVVIPFAPEDGLGDKPMLIRKADGAALYGTTDIATARHRIASWNPDKIVIVTDVRQQLHFKELFAACRKLGMTVELVHVWFGMLRLPAGGVLSTRNQTQSEGSYNLKDVFDEAVAHARKVVDENSPDLPDDERAKVAEAVGIGAIKYADLSQNPQTDIVFEWDKMLAMQGKTAPYLMYAYARCRSIFRKGGVERFEPGAVTLSHPTERELALAIARTSEAIVDAANAYRPNILADHAYELASRFAAFYRDCPVLNADEPLRTSRLTLTHATARALETSMELLGLTAVDRM